MLSKRIVEIYTQIKSLLNELESRMEEETEDKVLPCVHQYSHQVWIDKDKLPTRKDAEAILGPLTKKPHSDEYDKYEFTLRDSDVLCYLLAEKEWDK